MLLTETVLAFLTEALKTFNAIEPDQRKEIVQRMLDDNAAIRQRWAEFIALFPKAQ